MCGCKSNQGEYVRCHEGCSCGAHNQGGNAYGGINHCGTNFTPRKQDGVGNFSPCARSFGHTSYNCYEMKMTREIKWFSIVFIEHEDHFIFLNSFGTFVENETTFGDSVFELNLKNLVEKHLVYSSAFVDFLFKDEALNEAIVQNTKSCVKIENQSLGATLLYSL
ncbi:hypothetical protein M9H77_12714 [Catharanthus roseus]|uniref:Uncharacterized protein n=1 Tax=Catharanthus roseus TaxID=4058 RepID=A0ACC0BI40_CATRO|nr:hypothetical protein M9H77_12714 [Catharanthus roseus]